jgi:hypothetical protein
MKTRHVAALAGLVAACALAPLAAADWKAPRTPWGDPDLQGTWTTEAELSVPFERNAQYGDRQSLTDAEFAQRLKQTEAQLVTDNAEFSVEGADITNAGAVGSATSPPPHWLERRETSRRTSLVVDPPDGRVPAMTPEAQQRLAAALRGGQGNGPYDGPEDMSLWVRCITRGLPAVTFPTVYNANTRIIQGPGYIAITYEMIHDTRVIPIGSSGHLPPSMRQFLGDSRGHWDGDTLVVDVTNFTGRTPYRGSSDGLHLVERFRRVDKDTVRYEVTVDDPRTWQKPWTAALDMRPQRAGLFEYACHEGNYAMRNILMGSRAADGK